LPFVKGAKINLLPAADLPEENTLLTNCWLRSNTWSGAVYCHCSSCWLLLLVLVVVLAVCSEAAVLHRHRETMNLLLR
jgi:hypothetical protein